MGSENTFRYGREGGYPDIFEKSGSPTTARGMTAYEHFRDNDNQKLRNDEKEFWIGFTHIRGPIFGIDA